MIWDIIEQKIEFAGLAVAGESLFLKAFPADTVVGIGMFEPLTGISISPYKPGIYQPELRLIVRHNNGDEGEALANALMKLLTVEAEERYPATATRGAVSLKVFYPKNMPIQFPALDGMTTEWSLNFQTAFGIEPAS